jgi:hypothetical protein
MVVSLASQPFHTMMYEKPMRVTLFTALTGGTPSQISSSVIGRRGLCILWNVASLPLSSERRTQSPPSSTSATSRTLAMPVPLVTRPMRSPSAFMRRMTSSNFGYSVGSPPPITITDFSPRRASCVRLSSSFSWS